MGDFSNLIELLQWRATHQSGRLAFTFLADGETEEVSATYAELDRQARAIAAWLQQSGATNERVLLLYPPGLEYIAAFMGCLYAGAVAVPAYPPRRNRNLSRLQIIAADSQARFVLTTSPIHSRIVPMLPQLGSLEASTWLITDQTPAEICDSWQPPSTDTDALAFLQYTSGSTSDPKGVKVSHQNLIQTQRMMQRAFKTTEQSTVVGWLPLYHDMGLIGNILHPLFIGAPCILMSPMAFLQRPFRWLRAISRYKATTSAGPNFAYDLCVRRISIQERETLDLSTWSVAINGAEPVRGETLEQFVEFFAPCGFRSDAFYPCYGLAEATLMVSGAKDDFACTGSDQQRTGNCGQPLTGERLVVVNPELLTPCSPGEVGEIWVAGPNVAQGYWNRFEETERVFRARLINSSAGPFLRTGDLGFADQSGLYVKGRIKDLIIIRGANYYPQDIELTVEKSHSALRPNSGAAFSVETGGEERLVVVCELDSKKQVDAAEMIECVRLAVAEAHELHLFAIALIEPGSIPKTSSGKIQRHACRASYLADQLKVVAKWSAGDAQDRRAGNASVATFESVEEIEEWLVSWVAAKLGVHTSQIDTDQSIVRHGLDSLMAVELMHQIEMTLGAQLPATHLLEEQTLSQLSAKLFTCMASSPARQSQAPATAPDRDEYPLTYGQLSLWFLDQLLPGNTAYNISSAVRIESSLDVAALREAFRELVIRHRSLRSTFVISHGQIVQRVHSEAELYFKQLDVSDWSQDDLEEQLAQEAHAPFVLEQGPLLRVLLYTRSAQEHIILFVVHHIISDFWSLAVLARELGALYQALRQSAVVTLEPLERDYSDYVCYQAEMLEAAEGERLRAYWETELSGELPALNLPTDRPRLPVQTGRGSSIPFKLHAELTRTLKQLSRHQGTTLYMNLLAGFLSLLYRYSGQQDILIGSPTSGRLQAEFSGVVGYFVNPVVLRADFSGNPTYADLLSAVRQKVLAAFEHQAYPFALLAEQLQPDRDPSRSPIFQTMFVFHNSQMLDIDGLASLALGEEGEKVKIGEWELETIAVKQRMSQFDLTLALAETGLTIGGSLQYSTDLFEAATIARMAGHFQTLLEGAAIHPRQPVSNLPLLTASEQQQLISQWNDTAADFNRALCLHQVIEAQMANRPDALALVFEQEHLTYGELNSRANQLAHYLRGLGIGPDRLVGVFMERSVEMVLSLLATLKAGGAYVPLDPSYPRGRLAFMLEDLQVPVLLTQQRFANSLAEYPGIRICVDQIDDVLAGESRLDPLCFTEPGALAYVIYTSGSTGQPKGVMNTHRGICNRLLWMQEAYKLTEFDCVLQKTPFSFDVSVWEFFWPLMTGAPMVVARPEGHRDSGYLVKLICEQQVTTIHFVPSMLQVFLQERRVVSCTALKRVICSGEALSIDLQQTFFHCLGAELHNLYGPTEAAVDATFWACEQSGTRQVVPIGRPIANMEVYILDAELQPVAIGIPGELYIGGPGVARGYLRRAALTAERFIPHPYSLEPGARIYKTGDITRYLEDGAIDFLGRIDQQVKVRGYRIELGEIEGALRENEHVRDVVVTLRDNQRGDKLLVAYVVTNDGQPVAAEELRAGLKEKLPSYLVPSAFVSLSQFPLTSSGKIDRRVLPAPEGDEASAGRSFAAARTPIEEVLVNTWKSVLGVERVGIYDNFFDLGGHSLLVTQVLSRIRDALNVELPVQSFFQFPNVAELATLIVQTRAEQKGAQNIHAMLDNLERMSEEELGLLLERIMPPDSMSSL